MPDEIRARRFVLESENGRARAALLETNGYPSLMFMDTNRVIRLAIYVGKDGASSLAIRDQDGKMRMLLSAKDDGALVTLLDEAGRSRCVLGVSNRNSGFGLSDDDGRVRAEMRTLIDALSSLALYDADGRLVWGCPWSIKL